MVEVLVGMQGNSCKRRVQESGDAGNGKSARRAVRDGRGDVGTVAAAANAGCASQPPVATVDKSLAHLQRLGVVGELTNRRRGRVFSYRAYVERLSVELDVT